MKNRILPMTLVASAGLLTGCAHDKDYASTTDRQRTDTRYPNERGTTYSSTTVTPSGTSTTRTASTPSGTSSTGTMARTSDRYEPADHTSTPGSVDSRTTAGTTPSSTTPSGTYRADGTRDTTVRTTTTGERATDQYGSSNHTGAAPTATTTTAGTTSPRSSGTAVSSSQSPTNEWYDTNRDAVVSPSGEVREFDRTADGRTAMPAERTATTTGVDRSQPSTTQPSTTYTSGQDRDPNRATDQYGSSDHTGRPPTGTTTTTARTDRDRVTDERMDTRQPSSQPTGTYTSGHDRDPNRATDQYGSSDHTGRPPTGTTTTTTTTAGTTTRTDEQYRTTDQYRTADRSDDRMRTSQPSRTTSMTDERARTARSDDRNRDAGRYREVAYTPVVKTNDAFGSSPYSPANIGRDAADYDPRGIEPITRDGVAVATAGSAEPAPAWTLRSDTNDPRGSAPYTPANRGVNTAATDVETASVPAGMSSDGRSIASGSFDQETRRRHAEAMASQQGWSAQNQTTADRQDWTNQPDRPVTTDQDWNRRSDPIDPGQPAVASRQPDRERRDADHLRQPDRTGNQPGVNQPGQTPSAMDAFAGATPETRILSILQAKDTEEIEIGKLAQERGRLAGVRQFGEVLVRDHTEHLEKVRSTAQSSGVTLLTVEQTKQAMKLEKERRPELYGMPMDRDPAHMTDKDMKPVDKDGKPEWDDTHKDPGDVRKQQPESDPTRTTPPVNPNPTDTTRPNQPATDPNRTTPPTDATRIREGGSPQQDPMGKDMKGLLDELRSAEGDRFDALFAEKMHKGHGKVIRIVEDAQKKVTDPAVRDLLAKTLPTLREHERMAQQLMVEQPARQPTTTDRPPTGQPPTTPR